MRRKNPVRGVDADWLSCRVLIIDRDPGARSLLTAMLRNFGVDTDNILQTGRIQEARLLLENQHFDVVLCDYHFGPGEMSGQDLLDDMRRQHLLPLTTVFIMVTSEASYAKVAEAAESALDSYLLKPHNAHNLGERLALARHRKTTLAPIYQAIEAKQFELASRLCMARYQSRQMYWLYAARLAAELLLRLNRHRDAQELFTSIGEAQAAPWAKLGLARTHIEIGQVEPACQILNELLEADPAYADAYDLMGRAQIEQGDFSGAMQTYAKAAELTPASIARQQKLGMVAYYLGDPKTAAQALELACGLSLQSKAFDHQSLVLLAMMQFEQGDSTKLEHTRNMLNDAAQRTGKGPRMRRLLSIVSALNHMLNRQVAQVVRELQALSAEFMQPDFDMQSACNMLRLLTLLRSTELDLPDAAGWIETLARRFSVSKSSCEFLTRSCSGQPPYQELVKQSYLDIGGMAEQAMRHAINQAPGKAAKTLIAHGQQTMNVKLLDLASMVLQRHRDEIEDHDALQRAVHELRERFVPHKLPLTTAQPGGREPGGLALGTA